MNDGNGNLNSTLLNGTMFDNAPVIVINNAPGFQLEFFPIDGNYDFETSDCAIYGEQRHQGLRLCVGSKNSTIYAGKRRSFQ